MHGHGPYPDDIDNVTMTIMVIMTPITMATHDDDNGSNDDDTDDDALLMFFYANKLYTTCICTSHTRQYKVIMGRARSPTVAMQHIRGPIHRRYSLWYKSA